MASKATDPSSSWALPDEIAFEVASHGQPALFGHHAVGALVFPMVHFRGLVHIAITRRSRRTSPAERSPTSVRPLVQGPDVVDALVAEGFIHFRIIGSPLSNARHTRGREPRSRMRQGAPQTQGVHITSRGPCQVLVENRLGCRSDVIRAVLAGQRMTDDPYYAWSRASDRLSSCRRGCAFLIESYLHWWPRVRVNCNASS